MKKVPPITVSWSTDGAHLRITADMVDAADHEATWKDGRESWLRTMAEVLSRLLEVDTNAGTKHTRR